MSSPDVALVTPALIQWAIQRRKIAYSILENKLDVSRAEIREWERGDSSPPFDKAQRLAALLQIPFGYLFLPEPPGEKIPLPDFRTPKNVLISEPSINLAQVLNDVLLQQQWYRDYLKQSDGGGLDFVGRFTTNDPIHAVATSIREELSIGAELRRRADTWQGYLSLLSQHAEEAGILVMRSGVVANDNRRKLSVKEFQGFTIADKTAPLIFINARDYKTAQIFTLAHELAHIWSGTSGISKPDPVDLEEKNNVEVFCNKVASEVLVPTSEFLTEWRTNSDLKSLARRFWVSTLVILIRAYELEQISLSRFLQLRTEERRKQSDSGASGGDYYRNVLVRHSYRLTDAVIQEVREGGLTYRDGADLLGMRIPTLADWIQRYR